MRSPCKLALLATALGIFGVLLAPAAARPVAQLQPRTLVRTFGGIRAFAQDANTVAWAASEVDRYRVRAKNLTTGKTVVMGDAGGYRLWLKPPTLAVAGDRVLWTKSWFGTRMYVDVKTATVAQESGRRYVPPTFLLETSQNNECGADGYFAGAAGDGPTLVWAWTIYSPPGPDPCEATSYDRQIVGGGVVRVTSKAGAVPAPIAGIPGAAPMYSDEGSQVQARQVAVSLGRIAVLPSPAVVSSQLGWPYPRPAEDGPVEVHTVAGALVYRVFPQGTVRQIALAWPWLVALVRRHDGSQSIERYGANGALLSTIPVAKAATDLGVGPGGTVFRVGTSIYVVRGGKTVLLCRAKGTPIGLSVEGRRVAWAMNIKAAGLVVAFDLPR